MINFVWGGMILVSILCSFITGRTAELTDATLLGAKEGVQFVLTILGTMCFWNGMLHIVERSGLSKWLSKALSPVLHLLFKNLDKNAKAFELITLNMSANLLGLGNAATPIGIQAMKELARPSPLCRTATNEMVTLVVMNTASITIVPTTVSMLRSQAGSKSPMDILPAVFLSSLLALTLALLFVKGLQKKVK